MAELLSEAAIQEQAKQLEDWKVEGKKLKVTKEFSGFVEAIDFINKIVEPAEKAGHHPDLSISYNKVTIALTTHDAGGLTAKDFDMAKELSKLA
ncbi:MAG: 4a-hydroxytetrahydrobiopterin dehydratase [Coleofasciculaceae cyanobacterium]